LGVTEEPVLGPEDAADLEVALLMMGEKDIDDVPDVSSDGRLVADETNSLAFKIGKIVSDSDIETGKHLAYFKRFARLGVGGPEDFL